MNIPYRLLLILLFTTFYIRAAVKERNYKILFIQSYTKSDNWSDELNKGLSDGFKEEGMPVEVTTEYLNAHFWNGASEKEIIRRICRRAADRGTDLIVTSNDEALYDLLVCGDSLPGKIPVVFSGVEYPNKEVLSKYVNVTGFQSPRPFFNLLETAQKMFPTRKRIVVVSDESILGKLSLTDFESEWEVFAKNNPDYKLRKFNIHSDPMTQILYEIQISHEAYQSVLIIPYWGLFMPSIAKVSKSPCFTVNNVSLTQGGFCSLTSRPYTDAKNAAILASKVLRGSKNFSGKIVQSDAQLTFDYKQLDFFKVPHRVVPEKAKIINEPYWEKYELLFLFLYVFILFLLVFIVIWLIRANRREFRRRIEVQAKLLLQNRLVDQRNEFDNIFHSIREGVVAYGEDLRIHFVNRAALIMLNITSKDGRQNCEGLPAGSYCRIYNNGLDIFYSMLKEVNETGKSMAIPKGAFMQEIGTDNYFPVSGEIVPIYSKSRITGYALSFRNISDEEIQKRFFHLAVEESSIYPWQYSVDKKMFIFSSNFLTRIGFDESKYAVTFTDMKRMIHSDDLLGVIKEFNLIRNGGKNNLRLNFRQRNLTGGFEWWEYRMTAFKGLTAGMPYSILGVCQSIQRYKNTEQELIAARDKALQADKLKTAFLANVSHEIRTPLNSIVGFSELLKDIHSFNDAEIRKFVITINKNCELLLSLINDILDMSRIESGSMEFQFSVYNLTNIINEVFEAQRLNIPESISFIKMLPQSGHKQVVTDMFRLKQILNNLINNAVKFTPKGVISIGYLEEEPGYTTLFVEDTGIGISGEDREHIFERFYKGDNFVQGAGLGLSICQFIAERMNGSIDVRSELGKGARFTIKIPDSQ
ncbi:ATP-binding protein [uncultured Bacteroides sp.]|uniref:sensor histidine kinase n=1 Tax=uncultured Bacteroides sp. TaxID=162156 RepID=UPI002AA84BBD|nr:ATP-binding protein [uncultured Bacteroides sp.]